MELALDGYEEEVSQLQQYLVSILVFVELALDEVPRDHWLCLLDLFQSLFSWNLLLMRERRDVSLCTAVVSILVFVELALDAEHNFGHLVSLHVFQSLFSWNLLLMHTPGGGRQPVTWFQSLFSWNLLLMHH